MKLALGISRRLLAFCACTILLGCVYSIPRNSQTGATYDGPITVADKREPIMGGCNQLVMYANTCDYIFTDLRGRRRDAARIGRDLDAVAATLPQMSPWANLAEDRLRARRDLLPYEMYLLTISPEIVLVVPRGNAPTRFCGGPFHYGCIQSQVFRGNSYWYRDKPPIRPGSFWYSPDIPGAHNLDANGKREISLQVGGAVVRLLAEGEEWKVWRDR